LHYDDELGRIAETGIGQTTQSVTGIPEPVMSAPEHSFLNGYGRAYMAIASVPKLRIPARGTIPMSATAKMA
jgi:hypothetical protein